MKLAILGAGPGGYVAAIRAAQSGAQVTIIEEREVGGTCLNRGCIPTKAIIASTELLSRARELDSFGLESSGEILPNLARIVDRKNTIVATQIKGIRNLLKSWKITLKEGRGVLSSPNRLSVSSGSGPMETIDAENIIVATGSRPYQIPALPFDGKRVLSSDHALGLTEIPKSILIIGAGVIGCEFACIFRELGSEVTLLEKLPRALATEDIEISEVLAREFRKKKIRLITNTNTDRMEAGADGVHVVLIDGREIFAEKALVAVGRAFNSEGIGLEEVGVKKGICGEVLTDGKMQTNIPGVYAVGDVVGGLLLAHVASTEGMIAAANTLGGDEHMDYSSIPSAIYTSPEIASVGLREFQADERGIKVKTGHFQFRALAKAHVLGEIDGLVKVVSDALTDRVLGVHIIGPRASDLIAEAALAVRTGLRTSDIAETIHAHPTLPEAMQEASEDVSGTAIHIAKR
ncbi:MAG TPA: dihydrolipoyl dehydrogenase [Thermodesulfovibrionales bacterium]|nr:dihydrolipoyl dehydrogenase [Thermodesulfovibrionales bacterium]